MTSYTEAARCYRKSTHHDRAVELFERNVIPGMLEGGRLGQAAKVRFHLPSLCVRPWRLSPHLVAATRIYLWGFPRRAVGW